MVLRDLKGPFIHSEAIQIFVVAGIGGEGLTYLGEYLSVPYDLGLEIYLFRCRLKDPKRRQGCGPPFKRYHIICPMEVR